MSDNVVTLPVVRIERDEVEHTVEAWHLDRKVTIYRDVVLRIWGTDMDLDMSDEPRTLETVQAAFDWLYRVDEPPGYTQYTSYRP